VWLDPGEQRHVRIMIDPRATNHPFGTWDAAAQSWVIPNGNYLIQVGRSATDIVLSDAITLRRRGR
jgi:beta-glucosidase